MFNIKARQRFATTPAMPTIYGWLDSEGTMRYVFRTFAGLRWSFLHGKRVRRVK